MVDDDEKYNLIDQELFTIRISQVTVEIFSSV